MCWKEVRILAKTYTLCTWVFLLFGSGLDQFIDLIKKPLSCGDPHTHRLITCLGLDKVWRPYPHSSIFFYYSIKIPKYYLEPFSTFSFNFCDIQINSPTFPFIHSRNLVHPFHITSFLYLKTQKYKCQSEFILRIKNMTQFTNKEVIIW